MSVCRRFHGIKFRAAVDSREFFVHSFTRFEREKKNSNVREPVFVLLYNRRLYCLPIDRVLLCCTQIINNFIFLLFCISFQMK